MGVDYIKDGFRFDCVFVTNLIICSCFAVYMKPLDCVHKISFFWLCRLLS